MQGIYARVDPVRIVRWLPSIRPEGAAVEGAPAELDIRDQHVQAVCRASVLEHLVDYYGSVARAEHVQDGLLRTQTRTAALLARAATKLLQLPELAHMSTAEAQPVLLRMARRHRRLPTARSAHAHASGGPLPQWTGAVSVRRGHRPV